MIRGLYFCKRRKRWRVRLYDGHQRVVHLSYHRDFDIALGTWLKAAAARQMQRDLAATVMTAYTPPTTNRDLVSFLRAGLSAPRLVEV